MATSVFANTPIRFTTKKPTPIKNANATSTKPVAIMVENDEHEWPTMSSANDVNSWAISDTPKPIHTNAVQKPVEICQYINANDFENRISTYFDSRFRELQSVPVDFRNYVEMLKNQKIATTKYSKHSLSYWLLSIDQTLSEMNDSPDGHFDQIKHKYHSLAAEWNIFRIKLLHRFRLMDEIHLATNYYGYFKYLMYDTVSLVLLFFTSNDDQVEKCDISNYMDAISNIFHEMSEIYSRKENNKRAMENLVATIHLMEKNVDAMRQNMIDERKNLQRLQERQNKSASHEFDTEINGIKSSINNRVRNISIIESSLTKNKENRCVLTHMIDDVDNICTTLIVTGNKFLEKLLDENEEAVNFSFKYLGEFMKRQTQIPYIRYQVSDSSWQ